MVLIRLFWLVQAIAAVLWGILAIVWAVQDGDPSPVIGWITLLLVFGLPALALNIWVMNKIRKQRAAQP